MTYSERGPTSWTIHGAVSFWWKRKTRSEGLARRARLRKIGEVLSRFGSILMERPESIGFIRKGHSVRSTSSATTFKQTESYDVAIAGDIENAVNEVVALQDAMDRLGRIERDLISVARA